MSEPEPSEPDRAAKGLEAELDAVRSAVFQKLTTNVKRPLPPVLYHFARHNIAADSRVRLPLGYRRQVPQRHPELRHASHVALPFGPDHKAGIVPIALLDFGFEPSVGLYGFWDDVGFKGHQLRLRGSTWGKDWLSARSLDDVVAEGKLAEPPGLRDGYRAPFAHTRFVLDSRKKTGSASGGRLEVQAEQGVDLKNGGRLSTAIGIESKGSRDSIFQVLLGFGTETFESGAKLDSLRIVLGGRSGF